MPERPSHAHHTISYAAVTFGHEPNLVAFATLAIERGLQQLDDILEL